jgi:antitoxin FitA
MNKHVQIRELDAKVHKTLVKRADAQGLSLSEYLRKELTQLAARPDHAEFFRRLRALKPAKPGPSAASMIREDRDSR